MLEAKDQGHTSASAFKKNRSSKIFSSDLQKKVFKSFFQAISKRGKQKKVFATFPWVCWRFLIPNLKNKQIQTVVGTDANAHHIIRGSSDINPRGEDLLAYCVSPDVNFCNVGDKPTFRTKTREEVLNLALVNRCA